MKQNRSLALSVAVRDSIRDLTPSLLEQYLPMDTIQEDIDAIPGRNRVYTIADTILIMINSALHDDKSLKCAVDIYYHLHQLRQTSAQALLDQKLALLQQEATAAATKQRGRPRALTASLPKSMTSDISLNTAAYCKARDRVPGDLVKKLFYNTRLTDVQNGYSHFHDLRVFIADGTYLQLQDTAEIREKFSGTSSVGKEQAYPQGLLEVLMDRGSGQIWDYRLSGRDTSELALMDKMLESLPPNSVLLMDDLYNCFEILAKCQRLGILVVVPAKRKRTFVVEKEIAPGDQIITIKRGQHAKATWAAKPEEAKTLTLRRLECVSPEAGKKYILMTTVLDPAISKEELQVLYTTRWDIEIGIREIKTVMDINIVRSRTPEMSLKELTIALTGYNVIRKMIYASTKDLPFSPKGNLIHRLYTDGKDVFIDKAGRVYSRWSPGRGGAGSENTKTEQTQAKTGAAV